MWILREIEFLITSLIEDMIIRKCIKINYPTIKNLNYNRKNGKHQFAIFMYVLSVIHKNFLNGQKCTKRELYYNNILLIRSQNKVDTIVRNLCNIFQKPNWELGILASGKGLVVGSLNFIMKNGDIIDCNSNMAPTLIPTDFLSIERLETSAECVLIVEKDTIFKKFLFDKHFVQLTSKILLVTGKGFPDMCTRALIQRLCFENSLRVYALLDADPFGIEILMVYRHGSRLMEQCVRQLACPQIYWIGIHPSELETMPVQTEILGKRDKEKIKQLLKREYIDTGVRHELQIMQKLERKAEIENIASLSLNFLFNDYIPEKIRRNLLL